MGNSKTKVIAVTNQKGGVAKSTTTINVGAGLAVRGKNVLLVDMDGQGDLSGWLGYDGEQKPTISDLIWSTVSQVNPPIENAVYHSDILKAIVPVITMFSYQKEGKGEELLSSTYIKPIDIHDDKPSDVFNHCY